MGRKVHPIGFRIGVIRTWDSRWYAEGAEYTRNVEEDRKIRELVRKELQNAGVSRIEIERYPTRIVVTVHTSKPGIVIGRKGATVNKLRDDLVKLTGKKVKVDAKEIEKPELDAYLVAENIAEQIEKRVSYRRAMKQAVDRSMRAGAKGIMITCSGRLAGAEMARSVTVRDGRVPRHTLRADIDYAKTEAHTTYGRIGIKVWIYRGDVFTEKIEPVEAKAESFAPTS